MSVLFDGQLRQIPGAYSSVDASAMLGSSGVGGKVLAFIGEADAGEPWVIHKFASPTEAKSYFRGGKLLKAAQIAWAPSNSEGIRGAGVIYMVRANKATQAKHSLKTAAAADAIEIVSRAYDTRTHKVKLGTGTSGKLILSLTDGVSTFVSPELDANNDALVAWVNNNSNGLYAATKKSDTVAANVADWVTFATLGTNPVATATDWQTAIDLFDTQFVNGMLVATEDETVQAYLKGHIAYRSGNKKERRGFYGHALAETVAQIKTRAANLGTTRATLATPGMKSAVSGVLETLSSVFTAAAMAGIWAGSASSEPGTHKYINALGLEKVYKEEEIAELLAAGVATVEVVEDGYRVVQSLTTYTADENILFKELSASTQADDMAVDMRKFMEKKFVGKPRSVANYASVYNAAISRLNQYVRDGLLVGDEAQGIPAYKSVTVTPVTTGWKIEYAGSLNEPNNFILITAHYVPASAQ